MNLKKAKTQENHNPNLFDCNQIFMAKKNTIFRKKILSNILKRRLNLIISYHTKHENYG